MKLYRYEDRVYSRCSIDVGGFEHYSSTPVQIEHLEFEVVKETPCGYWIWAYSQKRWVSKTGKKRYAFPSKDMALLSFMVRKTRQIQIYSSRLSRAKEALALASSMKDEACV